MQKQKNRPQCNHIPPHIKDVRKGSQRRNEPQHQENFHRKRIAQRQVWLVHQLVINQNRLWFDKTQQAFRAIPPTQAAVLHPTHWQGGCAKHPLCRIDAYIAAFNLGRQFFATCQDLW